MLSHSTMSNSLRPCGLQPARHLCAWDFPSKNTGVGCHFLLQGIFPTQRSNPCLLCLLHWQADFFFFFFYHCSTFEILAKEKKKERKTEDTIIMMKKIIYLRGKKIQKSWKKIKIKIKISFLQREVLTLTQKRKYAVKFLRLYNLMSCRKNIKIIVNKS